MKYYAGLVVIVLMSACFAVSLTAGQFIPMPLPIVPEVYPGEYVAWDPFDQESVSRTTHYEARIDEGTWTKVGLARRWRIPSIIEGEHMIYVRACFTTRCGGPAGLKVKILAPDSIPGTPINFLPICRTP